MARSAASGQGRRLREHPHGLRLFRPRSHGTRRQFRSDHRTQIRVTRAQSQIGSRTLPILASQGRRRDRRRQVAGSSPGKRMTDLFPAPVPVPPLAEALRPKSLDEFVGQQHLLGPGKPLRLAFQSGKPHSMILWGPPGVGKTTLARLMADAFDAQFIALSAVFSGVKDIKDAVRRAEEVLATSGKGTILFVDEVHRFNKTQQDAFLPFVEQGLLTFVGATTENPSFEVIGALLSRTSMYVLKSLSETELGELFDRAVREVLAGLAFDARARERVIGLADPRALRVALDACETYERLGSPEGELALAEAAIYLACAAKSNAVYEAYNRARSFVSEDASRPVPAHLRNAPTKLMKELGHGRDYRYAHDEPDAYAVGESYFPEGMPDVKWYEPTDRGLEDKIREKMEELRRRDDAARKK